MAFLLTLLILSALSISVNVDSYCDVDHQIYTIVTYDLSSLEPGIYTFTLYNPVHVVHNEQHLQLTGDGTVEVTVDDDQPKNQVDCLFVRYDFIPDKEKDLFDFEFEIIIDNDLVETELISEFTFNLITKDSNVEIIWPVENETTDLEEEDRAHKLQDGFTHIKSFIVQVDLDKLYGIISTVQYTRSPSDICEIYYTEGAKNINSNVKFIESLVKITRTLLCEAEPEIKVYPTVYIKSSCRVPSLKQYDHILFLDYNTINNANPPLKIIYLTVMALLCEVSPQITGKYIDIHSVNDTAYPFIKWFGSTVLDELLKPLTHKEMSELTLGEFRTFTTILRISTVGHYNKLLRMIQEFYLPMLFYQQLLDITDMCTTLKYGFNTMVGHAQSDKTVQYTPWFNEWLKIWPHFNPNDIIRLMYCRIKVKGSRTYQIVQLSSINSLSADRILYYNGKPIELFLAVELPTKIINGVRMLTRPYRFYERQ